MTHSAKSVPQRFPRTGIPAEQQWPSRKIYRTVHSYITSHVHFSHDWQAAVVTLWAMGTYVHKQFPCYGHLWLNSPTTHSGKSTLLNVLSVVCYKASPPQIEPTAAVLFRFAKAIGGTLLIDEVDNLDPKRKSDVIAILNHYHKSGSVMRAAQGKDKKYGIEQHDIYCPKVVAGIESLPVTLRDRCIHIELHRKKESESVRRFLPEDKERQQPLRDQLDGWAARKGKTIVRAYRDRAGLGLPKEIHDDRARDILEPLFAVASVLPRNVRESLRKAALEIATSRKSDEGDTNTVVAGVKVLLRHFPKGEELWKLRTVKACKYLADIQGLEDAPKARELMKKLGFKPQSCKFEKQVLQAYRIPRKKLDHLAERYS